jgi:hypothetical protein
MGEAASVIKALSCQDCARYVCNACRFHSKCSQCCDLEWETEEVALPDDDSIVGAGECCDARKE